MDTKIEFQQMLRDEIWTEVSLSNSTISSLSGKDVT